MEISGRAFNFSMGVAINANNVLTQCLSGYLFKRMPIIFRTRAIKLYSIIYQNLSSFQYTTYLQFIYTLRQGRPAL